MDFLIRCAVLMVAAATVAYVAAALWSAWRWSFATPQAAPALAADRILRLRLLPLALALAAAAFAAIGLARFESRDGDEVIGWVLWSLSVAGMALAGRIVWRLVSQVRQTRSLWRAWHTSATPLPMPAVPIPTYRINSGFPIVAVIGIWRPRLVIDQLVLSGTDPDELAAILAHERSHLQRRDNLRRLLFAGVPSLGLSQTMQRRWLDATEEAADDLATQDHEPSRVHLASALVKVARLAQGAPGRHWTSALPASALYRGDDIDRRVRRLLTTSASGSARLRRWPLGAALLVATVGLLAQRPIHNALEVVVALLP